MVTPEPPARPDPAVVIGPATPESLLQARRQAAPSAPLITFYDDASGERAELSASSLGNWVAKTHFLAMDSLGLGVNDRALVRLPVHWLAAPIAFGCWFAGVQLLTDPAAGPFELLFGDAGSLGALPAAVADQVLAVSLRAMAQPDQPPAGAEDFTSAVRPMPDAWASVRAQAGPDELALDGLTRRQVVERAGQLADELGLTAGGRLLWTRDWAEPGRRTDALIATLLSPLLVGGSVVLVRNPDPDRLARRVADERITVVH